MHLRSRRRGDGEDDAVLRPGVAPLGKSAYQRALEKLSRRDHATGELRRALLREGYEADAVESTLERLRQQGAIDDRGFAARYARSRLEHHGLGRQRLREALRRRGVARATAEAGLAEALREVPEQQVLDRLARRYWKARQGDAPAKRARGLYMYLIRRGFPAILILARFRVLWPRHRDLLEGAEPLDASEE